MAALALDVRFAGRELYGGRPRTVASWSREAGAPVLVKTGRPHRRARLREGTHGQLPGGEGAQGEVIRKNAEGRTGSARSDEGFRASDCAHVFRAAQDDGGAGAWEAVAPLRNFNRCAVLCLHGGVLCRLLVFTYAILEAFVANFLVNKIGVSDRFPSFCLLSPQAARILGLQETEISKG